MIAAPRPKLLTDDLGRIAIERFRIARLFDWQREATSALLAPRSRVLVVAPTGGGKSLCYQLPAVALPGVALVLSPLISLMEDQVRGLDARGISATFIASTLPREENARRLTAVRRGEIKIVYAAPERLAFDGFLDALAAADLSLVAVDEAHCIVQWGHDFRPDYLRIGAALERLKPPRVLACTATATPDARAEIIDKLGWRTSEPKVILRGFARPNLHLTVREVSGPREALAATEAELEEALGRGGQSEGAAIVYAATRKNTEQIAEKLTRPGRDVRAYHAGLGADERARVSAAFADRSIDVVVATNAFGMGIDRPDVRAVIHAQPPASIEAYYQEVGRAGRDGDDATGLLCIASADIALRRRLADLGQDGSPAGAAEAQRAWRLFRELLRYVDAATCRHDFILRYFADEEEAIGGCGHCDVCLDIHRRAASDPAAIEADADAIRRALAGVARAKGGAGMVAIASMLAGDATERVRALRLDRLSTFGVLKGRSAEEAHRILRVLLSNDWIDLSATEYPVPRVTELGWQVMKGELPPRVRLPPPPAPKRATPRKRAGAGASAKNDAVSAVRARVEGTEQGLELFDALRRARSELAKASAVPAYVVATDRTLLEIAESRPACEDDLAHIHGLGPARIAAYGTVFLEVVRSFPAT